MTQLTLDLPAHEEWRDTPHRVVIVKRPIGLTYPFDDLMIVDFTVESFAKANLVRQKLIHQLNDVSPRHLVRWAASPSATGWCGYDNLQNQLYWCEVRPLRFRTD